VPAVSRITRSQQDVVCERVHGRAGRDAEAVEPGVERREVREIHEHDQQYRHGRQVRRAREQRRAARGVEIDRRLGARVRFRCDEGDEPALEVRGVLAHAEVVELCDPLLGCRLPHHDDPPRLPVAAVRSEARVLEDVVQDIVG